MQTCLFPDHSLTRIVTGASPPRPSSSSSYQLIGEWKCHEKTIHSDWTHGLSLIHLSIYLPTKESKRLKNGRESNEKDFIMRGLHFHINWSVPRQKSIDALLPWHLTKGLIDSRTSSSSHWKSSIATTINPSHPPISKSETTSCLWIRCCCCCQEWRLVANENVIPSDRLNSNSRRKLRIEMPQTP